MVLEFAIPVRCDPSPKNAPAETELPLTKRPSVFVIVKLDDVVFGRLTLVKLLHLACSRLAVYLFR